MKQVQIIIFTLFALVTVVNFSCTKEKTSISAAQCPDTISFSAQVMPIFDLNCSTSGCHDATTAQSGYNFTTYANIAANSSVILDVINHGSGVTPMPFGSPKLADSLIQQIECWVLQGKLDN